MAQKQAPTPIGRSREPDCESCEYSGSGLRYRQGDEEVTLYLCYRYPPQPDPSKQQWPRVKSTDWCGEYRPKRRGKISRTPDNY